MKEKFIDHAFSRNSLVMIGQINRILQEYEGQGYTLSLRQLYYQLVARDMVENTQRSYKNIGNLVSLGRQTGMIDWRMIEDRNRDTAIPAHWADPGAIVLAAAQQFRIDKWEDQQYHVEVMVEKDALSGVLEPVCRELDIGITANKGYCSSSTMYEIGRRLREKYYAGKRICILYLGDHDPSGIDMTRDIEERLGLFSRLGDLEGIEIERLALNWRQVEEWDPPENPAKQTDSRFSAYAAEYGESSWELDAVEPTVLADLVRAAVLERLDIDAWEERVAEEQRMRKDLLTFAETYGS
ncbi:MAG: hypothetical protein HPY85_06765 [Anaerolineae bacterium]|nr:hypothetical protein [Anaerolineae bacterium]